MLKARIEEKLRKAFSPKFLVVKDDSHQHINHGNYKAGGETHFSIIIVSNVFEGSNRIQRHQMVYACLEAELKNGVHALCLKTLSLAEAEASSELYAYKS